MKATIVIVIVMLASSAANADVNLGAVEPNTSVASVRTGEDFGLVLGAGYAHGIAIGDRTLLVGGEASFVMGSADLADSQLRATATIPVYRYGPWQLHAWVAPTVRRTHDSVANMVGLAVDSSMLAGWFSPRWFAAAEGGFDATIGTHITNSDTYRMNYPDARDGWYHMTGGNIRVGGQAGVSFGRYDAILRAGEVRDMRGDKPLLPIYATLAVAARF